MHIGFENIVRPQHSSMLDCIWIWYTCNGHNLYSWVHVGQNQAALIDDPTVRLVSVGVWSYRPLHSTTTGERAEKAKVMDQVDCVLAARWFLRCAVLKGFVRRSSQLEWLFHGADLWGQLAPWAHCHLLQEASYLRWPVCSLEHSYFVVSKTFCFHLEISVSSVWMGF